MGKSSSIILLAWARSVWILAVRNPVRTELLKLLKLLSNSKPKWRIFGLSREAGHSKPNQCNKYPKLPTQWNATETREFREFFFMQTSENRNSKVPYTERQPTVQQYKGESLVLRLLHLCCSKSGQGRHGDCQDRFFRHLFPDVQMSGWAAVARSEKVIFVYRLGWTLIELFSQVSFQF